MHSVTHAVGSALTPWLVRVDGDNSLLAKSLKILSQWRGFQTFSEGKNTFDSGRLLVPVHCTKKGPRESGRREAARAKYFYGQREREGERERGRGREEDSETGSSNTPPIAQLAGINHTHAVILSKVGKNLPTGVGNVSTSFHPMIASLTSATAI